MSKGRDDMVALFRDITACDLSTSRNYLEASGWNVEVATQLFFDKSTQHPPRSTAHTSTSAPSPSSAPRSTPDSTLKKLGLEFDAKEFGDQLQKEFSALLLDPTFHDIVLSIHGEKLPAHRIVLSTWSPKLRDIIFHSAYPDVDDSKKPSQDPAPSPSPTEEKHREESKDVNLQVLEIQLEGGEKDIPSFKQVLQFMYTGCVDFGSADMAEVVLRLAHEYGIASLKNKCAEYLFQTQTEKDIGRFLAMAQQFDCKLLETRCATYLAERFDEFSKSDKAANLSLSTWIELLKRDEIKVSHEEDVFRAVMKYAGKDRKVLEQLLPLVRFPHMPNQFLIEEVENHADLKDFPMVRELVHEAYRYKLSPLSVAKKPSPLLYADIRMRPRLGGLPRWSNTAKSAGLTLSNERLTAVHSGGTNTWQSVCADVWYGGSTGVRTWKLRIDKNVSNWLFIGVAGRSWKGFEDPTQGYLGHGGDTWSFGSSAGWGKTHNYSNGAYGISYQQGDVVEVKLDIANRTVSFSVNGTEFGVCHRGIVSEVCPAVTLYKPGDQVTLMMG